MMAATLLIAVASMGQTPVITFDKTTHDFGKINEADGRVTTTFTFKNEGTTPLVLSNVRASCGCTTPKWTKEPIEPGQTGEIMVTYNPNGRPGRFQKTITVTSNSSQPTLKLYIKGEVIPKSSQSVEQYTVQMDELKLKANKLHFGSLTQGSNKMLKIAYTNPTDAPITVDLLMRESDAYIKTNITLKTIAPKQVGELQFALQSEECPLLGPVEAKAYVVINGKRDISEAYAITLTANIKEDFSKLSVEQLQRAPIVEVQREMDLGVITKGKKSSVKLTITNVGTDPLHIRRVIVDDQYIKATMPKSAIKGGRKADVKLEVTAGANAAQFARMLTLITNDPKNPVINIPLKWVVQ